MFRLGDLYRHNLGLLTDLYQLTMAYGYWKHDRHRHEAVFSLTFRNAPFGGQFAICCGLAYSIDYLRTLRFDADDLEYLLSLTGADERPLFEDAFLEHLGAMRFECDVDAMPEGTVAFAHEPLVRVKGPILQCQLIETALLTTVNFQTLVATKAARVCAEAKGDSVIEFGLRKAQGIDGGVSAARAAYVGGCAATSNVLAGKLFDIPVKGTHAHSWVMAYDDELAAFRAYAEAMPNNSVLLVDTYDTVAGVEKAVEIGRELRRQGHELGGVRLDSGDLAELSKAARRILDDGGFPEAAIVASNDLDEYLIRDLKAQGARINVWGVGTKLATAFDQPALGGVYKLNAIRPPGGEWNYKIKLSEQAAKVTNPGIQQVRRYERGGRFLGDAIYDEPTGIDSPPRLAKIAGEGPLAVSGAGQDLLVPIFRAGEAVCDEPTAQRARSRADEQLAQLRPSIRRLVNPSPYPVGLEARLHEMKQQLM